MIQSTEEFVCLRNMKAYTRQLRAAADAERRRLLMKLLAEEAERAKRADVIPLLF